MIDEQAIAQFALQYTTEKRAYKIADKYIKTVINHIVIGQTRATQEQTALKQFPISTEKLYQEIGRYGKPQKYWFPLLHSHFPLFKVQTTGSNLKKEQTVATTDIPLDILLAGTDVNELFETVYKDLDFADNTAYDLAAINLKNLNNFIRTTNNDKYRKEARLIEMIATATDGVLPMEINESNFGRKYYKGINLQSCAKVIREAALGACWSVDIENAVVNWKYACMNSATQQQLTYTREYIQDKQRVRKHLAERVFGNTQAHSIKTIKRVMTAIGFGARATQNARYRTSTGAWTSGSISEIIYSPELREKLFNDPWMHNFMQEQNTINRAIKQDLLPVFQADAKLKQLVLTDSGKRTSEAKVMALAYQSAERTVMEAMDEYARAERLLLVHDGAYYRTRPDIASMQTILQQHFPLATLEVSVVNSWQPPHEHNTQHLEHIQQEERAANNGASVGNTGIHTERVAVKQYDAHAEPDWEQQQRAEYANYFPQVDPNMPEFVKRRLH